LFSVPTISPALSSPTVAGPAAPMAVVIKSSPV
jgi:hypothetical protein